MISPNWRIWISASLREAWWAPTLVFVLHVVASRGFAAYDRFPPLDILMHFFGGVAISFFIGRSYRIGERMGVLGWPAPWMYFVAVPALASTVTVFWEFAEYVSDHYFGTHAQLGLEDTLLDMFLGLLGSVVFLAFAGRSAVASDLSLAAAARAKDEDA